RPLSVQVEVNRGQVRTEYFTKVTSLQPAVKGRAVHDQGNSYVLGNARIVAAEQEISGALAVEQGRNAGISRTAPARFIDCEGDYLLPGFIDIHTDNFEKHAIPRAGVIWNLLAAAGSHDAVMIAAGTTTIFDSLFAGGAGSATRRNLLPP